MSEQYWGCSDKMSEANFSPAETLRVNEPIPLTLAVGLMVFEDFMLHVF